MKGWVERAENVNPSFDLSSLTPLLESERFSDLPPLFNLPGHISNFDMSLQVGRPPSGEMQALKCYFMEQSISG
eukprot:10929023-Karenia_brevis.AAC.1